MKNSLPPDIASVTRMMESLNASHNTETIINPKFYCFLCVQNVLYLRVTELFKDQISHEICSIPLNIQLKVLESDIPICSFIKRPRLAF